VKKIARKLFAKYHTFQQVLEAVEKYLEGQEEDMFLPLVRELSSMWIQISPRDRETSHRGGISSRTCTLGGEEDDEEYEDEWMSLHGTNRNHSISSHGHGTRQPNHSFHSSKHSVSTQHNRPSFHIMKDMDEMSYSTKSNRSTVPLPQDLIPALHGKYKFIDDTHTESMRHFNHGDRPLSRDSNRHSKNMVRSSSFESSKTRYTSSFMKQSEYRSPNSHVSNKILDGDKQQQQSVQEERDAVNHIGSNRIRQDHSHHQDMMKLRPMVLMVDNLLQTMVGDGTSVILVKSGPLYASVNRIMISAHEIFQGSSLAGAGADAGGRSKLILALYNDRSQPVAQKDVFDSSMGQTSRAFCEIVKDESNDGNHHHHHHQHRQDDKKEDIISMAKPGFFYQLEYHIPKDTREKVSLHGLICKIIPNASTNNHSLPMKDPEGESGRYMGPTDTVGHAHGKGIFDYENGCTFVGDFVHGKFFRGVYYKCTEIHGTMKNGKWDERDMDKSLTRDYVYNPRFFSREQQVKKSSTRKKLLSDGTTVEQNGDESQQYSFLCCS
jgi:hypothetical protein